MAERWEDLYQKHLTAAQARRVLADIYEELNGERLLSSTVASYATQWLGRKQVETEKSTFTRYNGVLADFLTFLEEKKNRDLALLTQMEFLAYRDAIASRLSSSSANNHLKILRIFMQDALRDGLVISNPATLVKAVKRKFTKDTKSRRAFTEQEVRTLLAAADGEWKGLILAGLYTGQRLGDLARLKWENVNMDTYELTITTIKTDRPVIVPIAPALENYLRSLPGAKTADLPVFPASNERVEIRGNVLSFHSLRHTATSMLKNAGVSDVVARDLIGHESMAVSRNYTHIDTATKRTALAKIPDLTR